MKTAISVPDEVFKQVSHHAARLGISRSAFFSRAAQQLVTAMELADLTEQINRAVALEGTQGLAEAKAASALSIALIAARSKGEDW